MDSAAGAASGGTGLMLPGAASDAAGGAGGGVVKVVEGEGGTIAGPVVASEAGGAGGAIKGPLVDVVGALGVTIDGSVTTDCELGVGTGVRSGAGEAGVTTTSGAAP